MVAWLPQRSAAHRNAALAVAVAICCTLSAGAATTASAARPAGSASVSTLLSPPADPNTGLIPSLPVRAGSVSLRAQRLPNGALRVSARAIVSVRRHFQAELTVSPCGALLSPVLPSVATLFWSGTGIERYAELKAGRRYTLALTGTVTGKPPSEPSAQTFTDCAEADLVDFREDASINQAVPSLVGAFLFNQSSPMGVGGALVLLSQTTPAGHHV